MLQGPEGRIADGLEPAWDVGSPSPSVRSSRLTQAVTSDLAQVGLGRGGSGRVWVPAGDMFGSQSAEELFFSDGA